DIALRRYTPPAREYLRPRHGDCGSRAVQCYPEEGHRGREGSAPGDASASPAFSDRPAWSIPLGARVGSCEDRSDGWRKETSATQERRFPSLDRRGHRSLLQPLASWDQGTRLDRCTDLYRAAQRGCCSTRQAACP